VPESLQKLQKLQELQKLAAGILSSENDFGRQFAACRELYDFFSKLSGVSISSENADDAAQTILAGGKAISPKDAAHCVLDFARTTQFLRGVRAALLELKKRFPSEKIEILYAGCGPFAPLIVPLLTFFEPDELSLTLIDFHERSIASVKNIFRELELEKFDARFVQADAASYKHPRELHLVICETMQMALKKEPQVALTLNLAPQLAEKGIFVPQKITVEACLGNSSNNAKEEKINLGRIFELDAEKIRQSASEIFDFPSVTINIPHENAEKAEKMDFMLLTTVSIFGGFELRERDSGITYPVILRDLRGLSGKRVEFNYIQDKNPRFEYRLV
jgi:hypothetical protein